MADRAAGDIPEVRMTLTQRLRRVEVLAYRFSEMLDLLIAHGHAPPARRASRTQGRDPATDPGNASRSPLRCGREST